MLEPAGTPDGPAGDFESGPRAAAALSRLGTPPPRPRDAEPGTSRAGWHDVGPQPVPQAWARTERHDRTRRERPEARVEIRIEITPPWPVRLPGPSADRVLRLRGRVLERLLHVAGEAVVVRAAQQRPDSVLLGAWGPHDRACREALARMRFAFGLDEDLREFHRAFRDDELIGAAVRRAPWVRPRRRPEPFEALAWAICEQLIEYVRAAAIQRRVVRRLGAECPVTGLRDVPSAQVIAGCAPAFLQSLDLSAGRSLALIRAAREIARGRVDLGDHEESWRRLRRIPGIGDWTLELLALNGQGRFDQVPAGDLNLIKWVGRLLSGGDPDARASVEEVREVFARYAPWGGLAACYVLGAPRSDPLARR